MSPDWPWSPSSHCTMGVGSFPWLKRRGVAFTTFPHPVPRLRLKQNYPSTPHLGLHGRFQNEISLFCIFCIYWTVHHLDSWIKRDQLDVTCFIISLFNAQHVSNVNTSIFRSLLLICWVISWVVLLWFEVCWCYILVWLGWYFSLHPDTPPQPNHNVTRTRAIQPMK